MINQNAAVQNKILFFFSFFFIGARLNETVSPTRVTKET